MGDPSRPEAVVLAAGRSSRMGEPKGLVLVSGRPWLLVQLDALEPQVSRVTVVLGHDAEVYRRALPELAARVQVVVNPDPDRGPFSSLQCGLRQGAAPGTPTFVLPVDVPAPLAPVWAALEDGLSTDREAPVDAAVPVYEGRGGHPVLLSAAFVARLVAADPMSRLDVELSQSRVARIPVDDPLVRLNLNAPEDWGKLADRDRPT